MKTIDAVIVGQIKRSISSPKGNWFLVWTPGQRFRAYPDQFTVPPTVGQLVSFLPDPVSSGNVRRIQQILFQPEPQNAD
jgi:hypothetical protein